jgi:hypothetical protein
MTSAKPHSMAAQTDAPDDLIAELARLMADDARDNQPSAKAPSTPVRIPGEPTPVPVPRFDFSASAGMASSKPPASPSEPFSFNFDFTPSSRTAGPSAEPVAPAAVPLSPPPASPQVLEPEQPGPLDQDSLADLIAAELAADMGTSLPAQSEEPTVEAPPARPANPDSFGVPPVFGLGSAPATVAASPAVSPSPQPVSAKPELPETASAIGQDDDTPDPLDEIERLVGPAVRMNVGAPAPSPALRSLATPVAPVPDVAPAAPADPRPAPVEPAVEVSSVDEAILAAAAATGAHVEWVNAGVSEPEGVAADVDDTLPPPRATRFRLNRAIAGPAVAVALLAVAGFGLYWVLGQGGGATGPAPLVVADTTPTKEVPEVEAPAAAQQSVVFNEMSGTDASADEQIVSRDQADTEAVVAANSALSSTGVLADTSGATVDPNQDGLVNRKVRTVTVRPDGTIVSGDDSLAGSAILPVDRPNVPEVPGADFSTPDLIASAIAETEPTPAAAATDVTATPAATAAGPAAEPGSSIAVVDATGAPISGRTVTVPMQRPDDFSAIAAAALASATAAPAATAPVESATIAAASAPQAAVATSTAGSAAAYVQLASQRSEAEAQQTVQAITTRYGVLFGGASPEIRQVDLGERGIFYRVLVPAASRDAAANICTNIKAAGGDCLLL